MVVVRKCNNYQDRSVMPQLEPSQYSKFNQILEELEPLLDGMKETPRNFVSDQIARNKEYAERTLVSPKQMAWLERLHEEFVGDTSFDGEVVEPGSQSDPRSDRDMDDEIPF